MYNCRDTIKIYMWTFKLLSVLESRGYNAYYWLFANRILNLAKRRKHMGHFVAKFGSSEFLFPIYLAAVSFFIIYLSWDYANIRKSEPTNFILTWLAYPKHPIMYNRMIIFKKITSRVSAWKIKAKTFNSAVCYLCYDVDALKTWQIFGKTFLNFSVDFPFSLRNRFNRQNLISARFNSCH